MTKIETLKRRITNTELKSALEYYCKHSCNLYNENGCWSVKGEILCTIRDYLMEYKKQINEVPSNWRKG